MIAMTSSPAEAAKDTEFNLPIIVCMRGTNSDIGFNILKNSDLDIHIADNLGHAAELLTSLSNEK